MKMEVKSCEIMKDVLETYKNIKTTRPYCSKEKWYALLGMEINKKYNIWLSKNDIYTMHVLEYEEQEMKRRNKKPVLVKRHIANEFLRARQPLPLERKRTFIKEENTRDSRKSVFDRLYQQRPKPDETKAKVVKERSKKKVTFLTDKYYSPNKTPTEFYEPFCKKICKRRGSLSPKMDSTVFERLYSERKQLNSKKMTDSEKRELYMECQREEIRRAQAAWASMRQSILEGKDIDQQEFASSSESDFKSSRAFRSRKSAPNNSRAFRSSESGPSNMRVFMSSSDIVPTYSRAFISASESVSNYPPTFTTSTNKALNKSRTFRSSESVPNNSRLFRSSESSPSTSRALSPSGESVPKHFQAFTSRESLSNYRLVYTSSSESIPNSEKASNNSQLFRPGGSIPNASRASSSTDTAPDSSMLSSTESVPISTQPFTCSTESVPSSTHSCKDSGVDNLDDFEPPRQVIYPQRHFVPTPEEMKELSEMVKLLSIKIKENIAKNAAAEGAAKSS
ncbi:hyphal wall protein 2-like [Sitophilus oryzae]|uniref:Hyphal wall protein 2-like n=1 Tax=Sitophilus oryzae TaxID=7048 RepID=A0A6J2XAU2_SITOR|nr:hyphal wall protein 2-like [Sitophilus oryzae]